MFCRITWLEVGLLLCVGSCSAGFAEAIPDSHRRRSARKPLLVFYSESPLGSSRAALRGGKQYKKHEHSGGVGGFVPVLSNSEPWLQRSAGVERCCKRYAVLSARMILRLSR